MNALIVAALLFAAPDTSSVYSLKGKDFTAQAKKDLATLKMFAAGLDRIDAQVKDKYLLFNKKENRTYTPEEKQLLLTTWGALFSYFSSVEQIRQRYWNFVTLSPTDGRHAWGFLLTHTALTSLLSHGLKFAEMTQGNKQLETLFDEPNSEFGVPQGSYATFKVTSIHVSTATQLMSGDAWAKVMQLGLKKDKDPDVQWAWGALDSRGKSARECLVRSGNKLFVENALDIVKDTTTAAIFPAQKSFAEWFGDTRVARAGKPLMTPAALAEVIPKMEPGDVVVTRQNWFLSNIALPGFWPHAELYVGTPDDLKKYFDADLEVMTWAQAQKEKAATFSALLAARYPGKWKAYGGKDFQKHGPIRVIEAISEGVSFTASEHSFGVDYMGVMRPRGSKLEKAKAIVRAFEYQGRPYDFEFDFFSDASLVCSELVYKSYAPSNDMKGLKIDLVDVAGRRTLPANDLVKLYDREAGKPDRQLDFVAFIDGREKEGTVVVSDEAAFRKTHARMKWDVAQK
ncbi:MAG: hypothetical protein H6Q89_1805 [Myxococcaceae bacterium]|nr:hypothetical protein [Myxococcaceae bacterium]